MLKQTPLNTIGSLIAGMLFLAPTSASALDLSTPEGFEAARRPMTNHVFFDLAVPRTAVHPFFIHHEFPDMVSTSIGLVPLGGDAQIYAAQIEVAFNRNVSFVAAKDGYISFNPDGALFSDAEGFADLAVGIKHAVLRDDEKELALGYKIIVELPTGDDDVFQGNGSGNITPAFTFLKLWDSNVQFAGNIGVTVPFDDDEESMMFMQSYHLSMAIAERVFPLVELNHYHVLDAANGTSHFNSQAGGAVPAVALFDGDGLINVGSAQADGADLVTVAIGARGRILDNLDIGAAYEFPITDEEESLYDSRFTVDVELRF